MCNDVYVCVCGVFSCVYVCVSVFIVKFRMIRYNHSHMVHYDPWRLLLVQDTDH